MSNINDSDRNAAESDGQKKDWLRSVSGEP
jgi:hypothetical protein